MITISTKTGDKGATGLANGERLPKSEPVFEAIGTIDELNSWLGLVVSKMGTRYGEHRQFLLEIQDTLFVMGGELAKAKNCMLADELLRKIETTADDLQKRMADNWHNKFLLPGGSELAANLDIARTVCRRAERRLVDYGSQYSVRPLLLKTLNRLSDYLYILRCFVNWSEQVEESFFQTKKSS